MHSDDDDGGGSDDDDIDNKCIFKFPFQSSNCRTSINRQTCKKPYGY